MSHRLPQERRRWIPPDPRTPASALDLLLLIASLIRAGR
jgi:hypothetical protein